MVKHDSDRHDGSRTRRYLRVHQKYRRVGRSVPLDRVWYRRVEQQRLSSQVITLDQQGADLGISDHTTKSLDEWSARSFDAHSHNVLFLTSVLVSRLLNGRVQ